MAIDAIATPGMQFDTQQANSRTVTQLRRVVCRRPATEMQQLRLRRMNETRFTFEQAGPRFSIRIHRPVHHERQLLIKAAVLVRHVIANNPATKHLHSLADPDASLHFNFASMPR
ncbi:hypothetical protein D3C87_1316640 [compost metagenome]